MHFTIGSDASVLSLRPADAHVFARDLLGDRSDRLAHSRTVARRVRSAAHLLPEPWRAAISTAAILHDIGYAAPLVESRHHGLDGARWLRRHGWPEEVSRLVAWHTSSHSEAALLNLYRDLEDEFERPEALAASALTWADLTSSPTGEVWSSERRLADILDRHPVGSLAHRATVAALPGLRLAAAPTSSGSSPTMLR